jgi:class 3 adenylate cyclase
LLSDVSDICVNTEAYRAIDLLTLSFLDAENPLSHAARKKQSPARGRAGDDQLGNYETEQLLTAIEKIADLLRKCWGIAGAGIISANLARTEAGATVVFNPTVPGKRVYALFGFVAVNDFSRVLDLGNDVLILINDVAKVLHEEVYRWALGDSGQCNKNLGGSFLMVFRIGDFTDVHDKNKRATDVVFNNNLKVRRSFKTKNKLMARRATVELEEDHLALASLPGIQTFTDRAVIGMLKAFAGIHRDRKLQHWRKDFRLGGGVGAYFASAIIGIDAGWAVEGAVGSEHKIDATYLSPHVNLASRMMSASKQYGVTLLMSQAVEELMSETGREKLRHLDTVYVKGSSIPQRIFTFDARYEGVDFFLFERTPEQADLDAEYYTPAVWNTDKDLKAMRQHVTERFMLKFKDGVDLYLSGKWEAACTALVEADNIMIRTVVEEGYIDLDNESMEDQLFDEKCVDEDVVRLRTTFGDGACRCLIQYMQRRNCVPPEDWQGVRQLMSK